MGSTSDAGFRRVVLEAWCWKEGSGAAVVRLALPNQTLVRLYIGLYVFERFGWILILLFLRQGHIATRFFTALPLYNHNTKPLRDKRRRQAWY